MDEQREHVIILCRDLARRHPPGLHGTLLVSALEWRPKCQGVRIGPMGRRSSRWLASALAYHVTIHETRTMTHKLIDLVVAEATSRGLGIKRVLGESKRRAFDNRLLLIEGRRCQVIPSKRGHPSAEYPHAEYFPLYLPRTDWPDFLVYVSMTQNHPVFHIVPRIELSKDTGRAPQSLMRFRDAWELLQLDLPDKQSDKDFEILSWQLKAIKLSARRAGLEVDLIKTKKHQDGKRWPPFIKRRVMIAGRKCAVFSATRLSQDPEKRQYNYAGFRVPRERWPEFVVYVVKSIHNHPDVFVVPRGHLGTWTTASLEHPELARFRNAWSLLTVPAKSASAVAPIQWKEPITPRRATEHSVILREAIRKAESHGLLIGSAQGDIRSHKGVQSFLYINKKPCQVMQANVISVAKEDRTWRYVSLNLPTSAWPEFLIYYSIQFDGEVGAKFYIIPRRALIRKTARSLESPWLKEYEEAWHLLR